MRTIIIITGPPGAGKGVASAYLGERGIPLFIMGDVVRDEMKKRGLEMNNKNSEMVARDIREKHGMDYIARKTMEKVENLDADATVCIDGPRDLFEVRRLSEAGRIIILVVTAPDKVRYQRLLDAGGYKKPKSFEEFLWRDERELDRGMGDLFNTKEFEKHVISNEGTKEELKAKMDSFLKKLKKD